MRLDEINQRSQCDRGKKLKAWALGHSNIRSGRSWETKEGIWERGTTEVGTKTILSVAFGTKRVFSSWPFSIYITEASCQVLAKALFTPE